MEYYIGIDSGGTKTEFILADAEGSVISRAVDSGCNPLDIGVDPAREIILRNVRQLDAAAPGPICSIYAGIAGANHVDMHLETLLAQELGGAAVRVEDDRRIVVSSTLGHADGCGMICGTGSSLSIIIGSEPIRQVGGLGYLIDTGGSGYELGQAGLKEACRYLDGRGEYTVLADLITKALGKKPWDSLANIYAGGRSYIASFAHTVFEGMEMGDAVCRRIVEESAYKLSELTFAAEKYFPGEFPVVMSGGIFRAYPKYVQLVCAKAMARWWRPCGKMAEPPMPPCSGILWAVSSGSRAASIKALSLAALRRHVLRRAYEPTTELLIFIYRSAARGHDLRPRQAAPPGHSGAGRAGAGVYRV